MIRLASCQSFLNFSSKALSEFSCQRLTANQQKKQPKDLLRNTVHVGQREKKHGETWHDTYIYSRKKNISLQFVRSLGHSRRL